jgi:hypothetical protein
VVDDWCQYPTLYCRKEEDDEQCKT